MGEVKVSTTVRRILRLRDDGCLVVGRDDKKLWLALSVSDGSIHAGIDVTDVPALIEALQAAAREAGDE